MRALPSVAAVFLVLVLVPRIGHADARAIAYTYEVENLDAHPDKVFVAWPRACGAAGDPLGAVSLQLNPDWVARLHDVDYEVLEKGKHHEVLPYCAQTTRIFALPAAAFPRASRVATADDLAIGSRAGETYAVLPALDEIDLPRRIPFFASDPRRGASAFRFDVVATARAGSPLRAVHDVLAIQGAVGTGSPFTVEPKRAVYMYDDGASETVAYAGLQRPAPTRTGALDVDAGANVAAGASADPRPSATPSPPPRDRGTRWVYAAAIGGLVAGGAIAHYRRKRAASPK